jgi:hypothetical protein
MARKMKICVQSMPSSSKTNNCQNAHSKTLKVRKWRLSGNSLALHWVSTPKKGVIHHVPEANRANGWIKYGRARWESISS